MRNLFGTDLFLLLYLKIIWAWGDQTEVEIDITVNDTKPYTIASANFPSCCDSAKYRYLLKSADGAPSQWRLFFTDLDIPAGSELLLYGHKSRNFIKTPLNSPKYSPGGAWLKPAIKYEGYALEIEFSPVKSDFKQYTGFNATYWLTTEKDWSLSRPLMVSPNFGDIMEGGVLEVANLYKPGHINELHYFCVWQLKPPPSQDLRIYIDIYSAEESHIKIRQGVHSGNPVFFELKAEERIRLPKRLTSDHGFYIELEKPTRSGNFTVVYGVYKTVGYEEKCIYHVYEEELQGFRCKKNSSSWCIPSENKCNGLPDCPGAEDEQKDSCLVEATDPPPKSVCRWHQCQDGTCRNILERCPEEKCPLYASKRCPGTMTCINEHINTCPGEKMCKTFAQKYCEHLQKCIMIYETCEEIEDECSSAKGRKQCQDGSCIRITGRCPEDKCPSYKPNRCGAICYYDHDKCNGITVCLDGEDEQGCSVPEMLGIYGVPWSLIAVGAVLSFMCFSYGVYRCYVQDSDDDLQRPSVSGQREDNERLVPPSRSNGSYIGEIDQPVGRVAPPTNIAVMVRCESGTRCITSPVKTKCVRPLCRPSGRRSPATYPVEELEQLERTESELEPPPSYEEVARQQNEFNELPPPPEYGSLI